MKKLLLAMAVGAALAYLFDPEAGSRRRDALRKKMDAQGLTKTGSSGPSSARNSSAPTSITDYTPSSVSTIP